MKIFKVFFKLLLCNLFIINNLGVNGVVAEDNPVYDVEEKQNIEIIHNEVVLDDVIISVSYDSDCFDVDSVVDVKKVNAEEDKELESALETIRNDNNNVAASYTFDIKILDLDGNELQPRDNKDVKIDFKIKEVQNDNLDIQVYHINDDYYAEELEASIEQDDVVSVETGSFSYYTVEFTYNNLEFVLPGGESILLNDILNSIGIFGDVEKIEVSNENLFNVLDENGQWVLYSLQPFDTTEFLNAYIDGILYHIVVTDSIAGDHYTGKVELETSDSERTVASETPIATVTIDRSKFTKDNVSINTSGLSNGIGSIYINEEGYVVAEDVELSNTKFTNYGNFALIYHDACVLSDGTRKNLEIIFNSLTLPCKTTHTDTLYLAKVVGDSYNAPAVAPLSNSRVHFAFRADIKVRVSEANDSDVKVDDTYLFTATGINTWRDDNSNFTSIYGGANNYNYSESMEPIAVNNSAINDESDIYVPATSYLRVAKGYVNNTYTYRFVGKKVEGGIPANDQVNYNTGFATLANAKGFSARTWSSAGSNDTPIEMYIMPGGVSHTITSSSGRYGKIELNTSGLWKANGQAEGDSKVLYGGRNYEGFEKKRTYSIPDGKKVVFKLTPEDGYVIDKLYVGQKGSDLTQVDIFKSSRTKIIYKSESVNSPDYNRVAYYTYEFPDDGNIRDQEIYVTWQPVMDLTVEKKWVGDDESMIPESIDIYLKQNGIVYEGKKWYRTNAENPHVLTRDGDNWTYTFYNLPIYSRYDEINNTGIDYSYEIEEIIPSSIRQYFEYSSSKTSLEKQDKQIQYYADGQDFNHRGINESNHQWVLDGYEKICLVYTLTSSIQSGSGGGQISSSSGFYDTQNYYDELRNVIEADVNRLTEEHFDENIDCVKGALGIGFNYGNRLDWATYSNNMNVDNPKNRSRNFKVRISVGNNDQEYYYYETYFNEAGNIFNNSNRISSAVNYANIKLNKVDGIELDNSSPINYFKVVLSNDSASMKFQDVNLNVKRLELLDKNNNDLLLSSSLADQVYEVTFPYSGSAIVFNIPMDITNGDFYGNNTKLLASLQLENFKSDYKDDTDSVYRYNGTNSFSQEELDYIYDSGFRSIRLPVTWFNHMDSTGTVDPEWFEHINTIVDRMIDTGFYVIVDIHHDTGSRGNGKEWIKADRNSFVEFENTYRYLVLQIAQNFKDYDSHLILEGPNEVANYGLNTYGPSVSADDYAVYNQLLQIFVDEIRFTGYNNTNRFLLLNTLYASRMNIDDGLFELPVDSADNKLFVGIHDYNVRDNNMLSSLQYLQNEGTEYLSKYNIVLGEFGIERTQDLSKKLSLMNTSVKAAYQLGIPMFIWDDAASYSILSNNAIDPSWDITYGSNQVVQAMISTYQQNALDTHDWNETEYTWDLDNSTVTASRTCKRDSNHFESETVNTVSEVKKQANCTEAGEIIYTAEFVNDVFETQQKTIYPQALGHDWSDWTIIEYPTDDTDGLKRRVCNHDHSHVEEQVITSDVPVSAWDLMPKLNVGWNLGNSLENLSTDYGYLSSGEFDSDAFELVETFHNNPVTTQNLIKAIKKAGFRSIRIPVSFYNHLLESQKKDDSGKHPGEKIDPVWIDRVKEIVDWALQEGLYVIINDHHDTGMYTTMNWIYADYDIRDSQIEIFTNLWRQYATYFKDYDYRLIFQSTGEIVNKERSFDSGDYRDFQMAHDMNQAFIDTVRETGGYNANRFLILETYAANSGVLFVDQSFYKEYMDDASDKLIFGVHNYSSDPEAIRYAFKQLYKRSVEYKMPFIIDECGTMFFDEKNPDVALDHQLRVDVGYTLASEAKKYGMAVMVWDNGYGEFGLIDRNISNSTGNVSYMDSFEYNSKTYELNSQAIVEAMINGDLNTSVLSKAEKDAVAKQGIQAVDFEGFDSDDIDLLKVGQYSSTNVSAFNPVSIYETTPTNFASIVPYFYAQGAIFKAIKPSDVSLISIRELDKNGYFLRDKTVFNNGTFVPSEDAAFIAIFFRSSNNNPLTIDDFVARVENQKLKFIKQFDYSEYCPVLIDAVKENGTNNVLVTWQDLDIADGYKVFKRNNDSEPWIEISGFIDGETTSFTDPDYIENSYYTVKAFVNETVGSNTVKAWTNYNKNGIQVSISEQELLNAKQGAKQELDNYVDLDNYREAEKQLVQDIILNAKDNIDASTTTQEISDILSVAKSAIDEIKTDEQYYAQELADAKQEAKNEIDGYGNPDLYGEEEKQLLQNIVVSAKQDIDGATSIEQVKMILADAKAAIDALPLDYSAYGTILPQDRPSTPEEIPDGLWTAGIVENVIYDPTIKNFTQEFRVYDYNTLLIQGTDYTVKYAQNTKVGTATITITGRGNYTGSLVQTFNIVKCALSNDDVVIILSKDHFVFNNNVQKATISSIEYKGVKLKTSDYSIEYEDKNSKSVRSTPYGITISLKGNYEGQLQAHYRIIEKQDELLSISYATVSGIKNQPYDFDAPITQNVVVKHSNKILEENIDYSVSYKNNINVGTAYLIIEGKDKYVGSIIKSFKITALPFNTKKVTVNNLDTDIDYIGKAIEPDASVLYEDKPLVEGRDYTLTYKNNINAGKATVSYKGIGNYSGSINKTFNINKITITEDMFTFDSEYPYEKGGVKPLPVSNLIYNKDYTLTYKNNTKLGSAHVTVKGKGNYQGTLNPYDFEIIQRSLSDVAITAVDKAYSTKKNAWKSTPVLTDVNGKKLAAGTDYNKNLIYTYEDTGLPVEDIPPVGSVIRVSVNTGGLKTNNYKGDTYTTYRICEYDLSKATIKVNSQVYTGKEVKPGKDQITITIGKQIVPSQAYDIVSYENNINKGSASITISGISDDDYKYGGTKTVKFSIVSKNICQIIRFHSNAPENYTVTGIMKDQYIFKNSKLNANTFKCSGKKFVGWAYDKNATEPDFINKSEFKYNFLKAGRVTDLYAIWQ